LMVKLKRVFAVVLLSTGLRMLLWLPWNSKLRLLVWYSDGGRQASRV